MRRKLVALLFAIAFCGQANAGEIFRCISASGEVMYTNITCPEKSKVQHVASYVAQADMPAPVYRAPIDDEALSARAARESMQLQQAQATGYRQAMSDYEQARAAAQQDAPYADSPDYAGVFGYPVGFVPFVRPTGFRPMGHIRSHSHFAHEPIGAHRPVPSAHFPMPNTVVARHR
jgi:hypothetical protein